MELKEQVCTIQQAVKLKELGIDQIGIFSHQWVINTFGGKQLETPVYERWKMSETLTNHQWASAFTVSELGVMLGLFVKEVFYHRPSKHWTQTPNMNPDMFKTQAEAYANYLIYAIENKYMSIEAANERLKSKPQDNGQ